MAGQAPVASICGTETKAHTQVSNGSAHGFLHYKFLHKVLRVIDSATQAVELLPM